MHCLCTLLGVLWCHVIFKSFWVYFCTWHDGVFYFIDLHVVIQLSQHRLLKRLSFLHCIFLLSLSKISWCVDLLLGSLLLHWSIRLFLCQVLVILILSISPLSFLHSFYFFFLFAALIDTFIHFKFAILSSASSSLQLNPFIYFSDQLLYFSAPWFLLVLSYIFCLFIEILTLFMNWSPDLGEHHYEPS